MQIFLSAFEDVPDPRASNARHDLGRVARDRLRLGSLRIELLRGDGGVRARKRASFQDFLKLKHAIPSHDTFTDVFRMIDPRALDAAFGKVLADVAAC